MTSSQIFQVIIEAAKSRYYIQEDDYNTIQSPNHPEIHSSEIVRLSRKQTESQYFKTIMIAELEGFNKVPYREVLEWVARQKERLTDPETADLYLFLYFRNELDENEQMNIESSELLCRKYVITDKQFIQRTFLSELSTDHSDESLSDPLISAIVATKNKHKWIDEAQWKKLLLSDLTPDKLVEELFKDMDK